MTQAPRIPVLMYHAVEENRSVVSMAPAVFAWQMRWLHDNGLRVIPLSELVQRLHTGRPLPPRALAITFDDGFASVYTCAFPILRQYGFPATVFLVPAYIGGRNDWPGQPPSVPRRPLLTWEQISLMDCQGIEFGAHGLSHARLDRLPRDQVERELLISRERVQEHVGHPVNLFAYPYGRYTDEIRRSVSGVYLGACTTRPGWVGPRSNPFALERIEAGYVEAPFLFRRLFGPMFPYYLGLRRSLRAVASTILRRPWV